MTKRMFVRMGTMVLTASVLSIGAATAPAATPKELLETIKQVGRAGQGNVEAAKALQELTQQNAEVLPEILSSFEGASPLAINWLRGGFETIADNQLQQKKPLPVKSLKAFLLDTKNDRNARRLAFEWIQKSNRKPPRN